MTILVAYATAHGSTAGVAERIADRLRRRGLPAVAGDLVDRPSLDGVTALVVGSAVHGGRWLPEAQRFLDAPAAEVSDAPVWLFSVCSVGDDGTSFFSDRVGRWLARKRPESADLQRWRTTLQVQEHRSFAGSIERDHWGRIGNFVLRALGGHFGDHRSWDDIDAWAATVAASLTPSGR